VREAWVPLNTTADRGEDILNPQVKIDPPPPGIIAFRFEESFTYPNSSLINSQIVDYAKEVTRKGRDMTGVPLSDRPWNDPGPRRGQPDPALKDVDKPLLGAVVLDFSAVSQIDTTSVQNLIDVRDALERYTDSPIEFHFAGILSPWIRRALIAGGFGIGQPARGGPVEIAPVVPPSAGGGWGPGDEFPARQGQPREVIEETDGDVEKNLKTVESGNSSQTSFEAPILSNLTPFFHFDVSTAVRAAEQSVVV